MELKEKFRQQIRSEKVLPTIFSLFLLVLVLSPLVENFRTKATDSFPLSHFPMFTNKRGETANVTYLVGIDADGNRQTIHYRFAGTGGMNQSRKQIAKNARNSEDAAQMCQTVAKKILRQKSESLAKIVNVQVVWGEYDLAEYFKGTKNPIEEKIRASCAVKRS